MLNSTLIKDHFGQLYKIHSSRNQLAPTALKAEDFHSHSQANSFLNNLIAPADYWYKLFASESTLSVTVTTRHQLHHEIAELLLRGKLKAYKVDIPSNLESPPEKRTLTDSNKHRHTFALASTLLISQPNEVMSFANQAEAQKYLQDLSPAPSSLKEMVEELELPKTTNDEYNGLIDSVSAGLVSGEIIVIINRHSTPPPKTSGSDGAVHGDKDASLGPSAGSAVAAEEAKEICNCTISELNATCSHGRSQNKKGVLQVVPSPSKTRMEEYELMGVKITLKEEFAGTDDVNCNVSLKNNKGSSCYFITDETNQLVNKESSKIPIKGEDKKKLDKWPIDAAPVSTTIQGHGCDKAGKTIQIEAFPNQYYTVQGDLSIFKDWSDKVNKGWEDWGKSCFNISPVTLAPKITGPAGSFNANWGWKENDDWRAYYNISADFGLNPILGVEIKIILSMATLALTAAGIPPNLSKLAADHLMDLQLSAGANCKATLTGKPSGKFYSDGKEEITGEAKFSTEGGVILEIIARAGSDYIVSASLSVSGEAKIAGEDLVSLDKTGLYLQSNIALTPFIGTAKVTIRYFKIRTKTKEKKWEPWKKVDLYKSDKRKLLPK